MYALICDVYTHTHTDLTYGCMVSEQGDRLVTDRLQALCHLSRADVCEVDEVSRFADHAAINLPPLLLL